ncbi:MAG: ADP-ribosylglycohydrolase family protein [Anaerolineae bacterium]|nr:ADP-ribosylglycohydrolase family protein [Anaerolineae bacterium]
MPANTERIAGGLMGLLIGDALGVPYEFHAPSDLPPIDKIEFTPPDGFQRSHRQVPPGTWSDDGAQALVLLASLLAQGKLELEDFAQGLVAWLDHGYMAVDGLVFDVGIQTSTALRALKSGTPAAEAGPNDEYANGNGSLMRVLPLALWHRGTDEALVADAHRQSLPTHGHLRAQVCCALYCLWARRHLQAVANPWQDSVTTLQLIYGAQSPESEQLEQHIQPLEPPHGQGSGYVVDSLRSARWAVETGATFERVVKNAVSLGHDTDTTACIAGGIAGIRDGLEASPLRWRRGLRGQDLVEPLLKKLLNSTGQAVTKP